MKAIQIKRYGSSDVVEIDNSVSVPSPSLGKILVNIKAAGVNPVDWKIREGNFQQMIPLQFPSTLGMDFSGIVRQVGGEDVPSDFKQDDEVYGQASVFSGGSGAFAELALANKDSITHKPKTLNHLESAALPLVSVSAWQALIENIGLSKGSKDSYSWRRRRDRIYNYTTCKATRRTCSNNSKY
jgi:NADPH:quinone reductase-like Zn-dependent oxidoreductase